MALRRSLEVVSAIAKTEVVRSWRSDESDRFVVIGVLLGFLYTGMAAFGGYWLGTTLRTGEMTTLPPTARLLPLGMLVFGSLLFAQRTIKTAGTLDAPAGVLTATSPGLTAFGLALAECLKLLSLVGFPGLIGVLAFTVGTRAPLAGAWLAVVTFGFALLVVLTGFTLGMAGKALATRSRVVSRHRGVIGLVASVGGVLLYFTAMDADVATSVLGPLTATPLGWIPDLALALAPGMTSTPLRIAGGGAVLLAGFLVSGSALARLAPLVWLTSSVSATRSSSTADADLLDRLFADRVPATTWAVVRKSWLRARRAPFRLQFAIVPYFVVLMLVFQVWLEGAGIPPVTMLAVSVAGAFATGGAFTLNPIGGEGDLLPVTLTAGPDSREFVAGLALAGWIVGLPLTVGTTVLAGMVVGAAPVSIATATLGGIVLALAAPGIAAGLGVHFPRFEKAEVRGARKTVVPSSWAFGLYAVVVLAAGSPFLLVGSGFVAPFPARAQHVVTFASIVVSGLVAGVAAWLGFGHAARSIDGYYPPADEL